MIDLNDAPSKQTTFLRDAFNNQKIAHSYLFVDPTQEQGIATAYWLACLFYCSGENKPDGQCNNCQRILMGNHPDVFLVKSDSKKTISIDQVRPLKEELSKSPVEGNRRFFFIQNSEKMTLSANNALLNLLEEPVAPVVTILIANNENQILPTVRSRTQIVRFLNEANNQMSKLIENGFSQDEISDLGKTEILDQESRYLLQEILGKEDMALIRAHKLAEVSTPTTEKYIFYLLKQLASEQLQKNSNKIEAAKILQLLIDCDKMRTSNVSFKNCLDYMILNY